MMFPMVLPLPRTSLWSGTGAECFFLHAGSASMVSGFIVGTFPSKVTVPVTVEAADATPGQPDTATSTAASNNLFSIFTSRACSAPWSSQTAQNSVQWADCHTAARRPCNPASARAVARSGAR